MRWLALSFSLLVSACASSPPPAVVLHRAKYLETERKALQYRVKHLEGTLAQDSRLLELKRAAMARAEALDTEALSGGGSFFALRKSYLDASVKMVLPVKWEVGDCSLSFTEHSLDMPPEGALVRLRFEAHSKELVARGEDPARGWLRGRLQVVLRKEDRGALALRFVPELLEVDEASYRVAQVLEEHLTPDEFEGLLPDLPVPVALPTEVTWHGKAKGLDVKFQTDRVLVLPEYLVVPFGLEVSAAPPRPAEPAPIPEERPVIPVGRVPGHGDRSGSPEPTTGFHSQQ